LLRKILLGLIVLAILVITVTPSGSRPPEPISLCLACGSRGLADGILNLFLFVPLGVVLGWRSRSPARTIFLGALLSLAIEVIQIRIPGRDPSLSDLVLNTLGTACGVAIAAAFCVWLDRQSQVSRVFALGSFLAAAAVMLATAWLLQPVGSATVGQDGKDLVVRSVVRASTIGLDQPEYWLAGALRNETLLRPGQLFVRREGAHWQITTTGEPAATLGPTLGQGWTLLAYPDAIGRRWGAVISGLWILALCAPIGFFARARSLIVVAVLLVALLALLPRATGLVDTSWREWLGAGLGILLGVFLDFLCRGFRRYDARISQRA
jgi:hypothetical protein